MTAVGPRPSETLLGESGHQITVLSLPKTNPPSETSQSRRVFDSTPSADLAPPGTARDRAACTSSCTC